MRRSWPAYDEPAVAAVVAAVVAQAIVASVAVGILVRQIRAGVPIGTFGVDIIAGPVIERADGTRVRRPLPADSSIHHAARVLGGWLIELFARSTLGLGLWYVRDGEPARQIAIFETHWNWEVSADGQILVCAGRRSISAEGVGFEPTSGSLLKRFSRPRSARL